jgi:hypothetical protein
MSSPDIVFLIAMIGGYFAFVLLLGVLDEHRLERRR